MLGGWLGKTYGTPAVHLFCAILALIWLGLVVTMKPVLKRPTSAANDEFVTQN